MRKLILLFLTFSLAACASVETPQSITAKSLLSSRQTVIAAAVTADTLCKQKAIKASDCEVIKTQYERFQVGYNIASGSFVVYVQTGNETAWKQAEAVFQKLSADTLACLATYGGVK